MIVIKTSSGGMRRCGREILVMGVLLWLFNVDGCGRYDRFYSVRLGISSHRLESFKVSVFFGEVEGLLKSVG